MKELFQKTSLMRAIAADGEEAFAQAVLAVFPDEKYLRDFLKESAKLFFGAGEGSRVSELIEKECYSDCLIYPAEGKKLTAEICGEILEESLLRPVEGGKKLVVLDGFHLATPLVQNKLLKLLEEPPAGVHLLLGAQNEYPILPTVLSRVKKFSIAPFTEEEVERVLNRKYPEEEAVKAAAAASGGLISVGESLLLNGGEDFRLAEEFLSLEESEKFCREMAERKEKREFFAVLRAILRDMLFLSTGQEKFVKIKRGKVKELAAKYPTGAILSGLELLTEAERQIQFNANFASCLYTLALGLKKETDKWKKLSL